MSRFLVVELETVERDDPDAEPGSLETDAVAVHATDETYGVHRAIRLAQEAGHDWSVWERSGGRYVRRAVIFKMDGRVSYDVEIAG